MVPSSIRWSDRTLLLLLFCVGLLLRLFVAEFLAGGLGRPAVEGDERSYVGLAQRMSEGQGYVAPNGKATAARMPAIPFLAYAVYSTQASVVLLRCLMCVLGSTLVFAVYLLASEVLPRRAAMVAAALTAIMPSWVYPSSNVETDVVTAVLATVMAWLLLKGLRTHSYALLLGGGIVLGVACLTRPTSYAIYPAVILWLLMIARDRKRFLVSAALISGATFVVVLPWGIRNQVVLDKFIFLTTKGGSELWKSNNPNATGILAHDHAYFRTTGQFLFPDEIYPDEVERAAAFQKDALRFINNNPSRFLRLSLIRVREFWKVYSPRVDFVKNAAMLISVGLLIPFFLIQSYRVLRRRSPESLLVLIILFGTLLHTVFTAIVRYRVPLEPMILILAIGGFLWLYADLGKRGFGRRERPQSLQPGSP